MDLLLQHLVGDYLLQSTWMASEKGRSWRAALAHSAAYSLPFLPSLDWAAGAWWWQGGIILGSHYLVDRYRLPEIWCRWAGSAGRLGVLERSLGWKPQAELPGWLLGALYIVVDNTFHLLTARAVLGQ